MEQLCKMLQQMANGIATFSNLKPNTYILVEIATNEDYIIDTTEHKIEVGYDVTITKELTNEHKKGNLRIFKVDKDNHEIRLGNVAFDLYSVELDKIIGTYKTSVDGEIYIENIRTRWIQTVWKKYRKMVQFSWRYRGKSWVERSYRSNSRKWIKESTSKNCKGRWRR